MRLIIFLTIFYSNFVFSSDCLKIGVLGEFKSANSRATFAYGQEMRKGIEIAQNQLKAKCFDIIEIDINNSISNIDGRIRKFSNEFKIKYFVGLGTSSQVHAAIRSINETQSILLSPTASDESILEKSDRIVLMGPTNSGMLNKIISELLQRKIKKVSVIYGKNDLYSTSMANGFEQRASNAGIKVIYKKDIRIGRMSQIEGINISKLNESELLFLPVYELDVSRILGFLEYNGFKKNVIGSDSWGTNEEVIRSISKTMRSKILFSVTGHLSSDPTIKKNFFYKNYFATFKKEPIDMSSFSYDAIQLINRLNETCVTLNDFRGCLSKMNDLNFSSGPTKYNFLNKTFNRNVYFVTYE